MAAISSSLGAAPVLLLLALSASSAHAWTDGRATFYGNEPWYWSIHYGSEFGALLGGQRQLHRTQPQRCHEEQQDTPGTGKWTSLCAPFT